jgi:hypothetical protein
MASSTNKLARLKQNQRNLGRHVAEDIVTVDQTLARLEEDIRRLKIEFGIYFNGGLKRAPHESRGRVEALIKRLSDDRGLTYAQRYLLNNLVARYTAQRELWRRMFKQRGEGTF